MAKYILTQEEQEILEAFESGEIQPIQNANEEIEKHKKYATATFKQDKKINICIASRDLSMIQKLALLEGFISRLSVQKALATRVGLLILCVLVCNVLLRNCMLFPHNGFTVIDLLLD